MQPRSLSNLAALKPGTASTDPLQAAFAAYRQGDLASTKSFCEACLRQRPKEADAHHLLAITGHADGDIRSAIRHARNAIRYRAGQAQFHNTLGNLLQDDGQIGAARDEYERAIVLDAQFADAWFNLGTLHYRQGETDASLPALERAVALQPSAANYLNNLGNALRQAQRNDEALAAYDAAYAVQRDNNEVVNNIASLLVQQNKVQAAIDHYAKALQISPRNAGFHYNRAKLLAQMHQPLPAIEHLQQAIALKRDFTQAYSELTLLLRIQGRLARAREYLQQAIEENPDDSKLLTMLSDVLLDQGQHEAASEITARVVRAHPEFGQSYSGWLMGRHYVASLRAADHFQGHRDWAARQPERATTPGDFSNTPYADRVLRIGYVSQDFRRHSVSYFLQELIRHHDPQQVQIYCYARVREPDAITDRYREAAHGWRDILGASDAQVRQWIQDDGIDILVDLGGHSGLQYLTPFMHKAAPLQLTYLGYPDTTGLDNMDYRITDAVADPLGVAEQYHSEALLRLPGGFLAYTPPPAPAVTTLPALDNGHLTFCCFNNRSKINADVLAAWARLAARFTNSRFIIKARGLNDTETRALFIADLEAAGIPIERVELHGFNQSVPEHLALYGKADIALDTFPYNGTTTTCDALWMGLPVMTVTGDTHMSRVSASLLQRVDLAHCIASDADELVERVSTLGDDLDALATLRAGLRERMQASPLCSHQRLATEMETAYRDIWQRWCERRLAEVAQDKSPDWLFILSLPRSGSTWAYNVLRDALVDADAATDFGYVGEGDDLDAVLQNGPGDKGPGIVKFHVLTDTVVELLQSGRARAICTQRDLRDICVSLMAFDDDDFASLHQSGRMAAIAAAHREWLTLPNLLPVDYSDIIERPAAVIRHITNFAGHTLGDAAAIRLAEHWSIAANRARQQQRQDNVTVGDRQFNPATLLHHNHIQSGATNRYRQVLDNAERLLLEAQVKHWLRDFGYAATVNAPTDPDIEILMAGDFRVCLPNDINKMSTFAALEQEDWFEDEIKFLRHIITPGQQVIDVGANYGMYVLNNARLVGAQGRVIAFEPSATTAQYLRKGIAANDFTNVTLYQAAVSDHAGEAFLTNNANSELNQLQEDDSVAGESVALLTLNEVMTELGNPEIDFVKLDAEGHEVPIVTGGAAVFEAQSPLVMFELKHGDRFHTELFETFTGRGYKLYHLLPGPEILVPFSGEGIDPYQLNLFACKADRAAALAQQQRLVLAEELGVELPVTPADTWIEQLAVLPYAQAFLPLWEQGLGNTDAAAADYLQAINQYACSQQADLPAVLRFALLKQAFIHCSNLVKDEVPLPVMFSLARIAADLGMRDTAVKSLDLLIRVFETDQAEVVLDLPFLAPSEHFAALDASADAAGWCLAALLDARERLRSFSSYFTGERYYQDLEKMRQLPCQQAEMERRRQLVRIRAGLQQQTETTPVLEIPGTQHLNPIYW